MKATLNVSLHLITAFIFKKFLPTFIQEPPTNVYISNSWYWFRSTLFSLLCMKHKNKFNFNASWIKKIFNVLQTFHCEYSYCTLLLVKAPCSLASVPTFRKKLMSVILNVKSVIFLCNVGTAYQITCCRNTYEYFMKQIFFNQNVQLLIRWLLSLVTSFLETTEEWCVANWTAELMGGWMLRMDAQYNGWWKCGRIIDLFLRIGRK